MNEKDKLNLKIILVYGGLIIGVLVANGVLLAAGAWIVVKVLKWTNVL